VIDWRSTSQAGSVCLMLNPWNLGAIRLQYTSTWTPRTMGLVPFFCATPIVIAIAIGGADKGSEAVLPSISSYTRVHVQRHWTIGRYACLCFVLDNFGCVGPDREFPRSVERETQQRVGKTKWLPPPWTADGAVSGSTQCDSDSSVDCPSRCGHGLDGCNH